MVVHINGILRGKNVELDGLIPDLPDGSPVSLDVRPLDPSIAEKKKKVQQLCGAFSSDVSIGPIFDEIERNRRSSSSRHVNLDDPS